MTSAIACQVISVGRMAHTSMNEASATISKAQATRRVTSTDSGRLRIHTRLATAQLRLTLVAAAFIYLLFGLADLSRLGPGHDAYLSIGGRIIVALRSASPYACPRIG